MRALLLSLTACLLLAAPAAAQDSMAPPGAEKHWLPDTPWVNNLWLPFDEHRLYDALDMTRGEVFQHVRVDAHNSLAQLGRRKGMTVKTLAVKLVANRRGAVSDRSFRLIRKHSEWVLTQPHLSQHLLFHALHQVAIAEDHRSIFGTNRQVDFYRLRRAELSPLQIGELHGRTRTQMATRAERALRDAAALGVRRGELSPRQRDVMLDRQLRQLPRWLGQKRYNGPTGGKNRPKLPPADVAKRPSISADGALVVWDAYRTSIPQAERLGEIHVRARRAASPFSVSRRETRSNRPFSAYNATVAAGGTAVAYETAESTFPLAKRVGQMTVWVCDLATGKAEKASHLGRPAGAPTRTAFNPSLSADGRLVLFEATDSGRPSRNGLWLFDRTTKTERLLLDRGSVVDGGALLPRLSGDGRTVVFTEATKGGATRVHALDVASGARQALTHARFDSYEPSVSADGGLVAFTSRAGGPRSKVFVHDRATGRTSAVSGVTRDDALEPALSPDGRFVAFIARRPFRGGSISRLRSAVFLHDRQTGRTQRLAGATGYASEPQVSEGGRRVAWVSTARTKGKPFGIAGVLVHDMAAHRTTLASEHRLRGGRPQLMPEGDGSSEHQHG